MTTRVIQACVAILVVGCGGPAATTGYGHAPAESAPAPFDIPLLTPDGAALELSELHGRTVLLFLFATFDLPSQAALQPLSEVATEHPEMTVVGIALQPNARELLEIFGTTLDIDFPLAYETENLLLRGLTDVGQIDGVPTYVLLDHNGIVTRKAMGPMSTHALRRFCGFD